MNLITKQTAKLGIIVALVLGTSFSAFADSESTPKTTPLTLRTCKVGSKLGKFAVPKPQDLTEFTHDMYCGAANPDATVISINEKAGTALIKYKDGHTATLTLSTAAKQGWKILLN
jgi:hypothetical protein